MTAYHTSTDTSTSLGNYLVQTAYDRLVEFELREQPLFRNFITKRPARQAMPGSVVTLQRYNDMAVATSALTETVDPDAIPIGNTTKVDITLYEYGNAALVTRKLQLFSLADVDPAIADIIAYNMADSIDTITQNTVKAGTNVIREISGTMTIGGARTGVTTTDTVKSRDFRAAVAKLRGNAAVPVRGTYYGAVVHPDVSMDLRAETGAGGWRTPQEYGASQQGIFAGEIGTYEGAVFVENARCFSDTGGASSETVFNSYVMGRQAIAEAVAEEPHVVIGPVADRLMRFRPIGWYGVLGSAVYRNEALFRIETAGSLT
jgi:N4-gp56 family major capsid protein